MEKFAVIIVGAGASGLMCALNTTKKTLLIEASPRVGQKILVTGNGKCNLTNDDVAAKYYNTPLVTKYLPKFDQGQTLAYFANLGLMTYADPAGRRYPLANSANAVLDLLLKALSLKHNVTTVVNARPLAITQANGVFTVTTKDQTYVSDKLVLATGGNSSAAYLASLQVNYRPFRPSLVGLKTTKNKGLAGVRVSNVRVNFGDFHEVGEILFKEDGISGIVIFNLAAHLARRQISTGQIMIDLLANLPENNLLAMLRASLDHNPQYTLLEILEGFLHKSLARNILDKLSLATKMARDATPAEVNALVRAVKNFTVAFTGFADNNQVYTGGVDLADLDDNLQHKHIKNLYCCGEIVNVDGVCGGYNLQWAWTSGHIVAAAL